MNRTCVTLKNRKIKRNSYKKNKIKIIIIMKRSPDETHIYNTWKLNWCFNNQKRINVCEQTVKMVTWYHLYCVHIYSLLIEKYICDCWNVFFWYMFPLSFPIFVLSELRYVPFPHGLMTHLVFLVHHRS